MSVRLLSSHPATASQSRAGSRVPKHSIHLPAWLVRLFSSGSSRGKNKFGASAALISFAPPENHLTFSRTPGGGGRGCCCFWRARGKAAKETTALPLFHWPVQGRIIASFGSLLSGGRNDGIDLAVPEGTPVTAAEDGVVSYAGNGFAGQGNLVLIRHSNGYSTVYAHAKELLVKRGDQIKRGQVIAHSGQTGNVNAPQLHFEVRRGATPLDPVRFLKS